MSAGHQRSVEEDTVQALMDLALPRFKKSDEQATPKTRPWSVALSSPASPASVDGGNRMRSPSPCVDLNVLSSDDSEVDVTPQDYKITTLYFRRFSYPGGVCSVLLGGRSSAELAESPVPDTTLDGRLMEGTTYLEHSALGVSLDSRLMEGMSSPEPVEQSVLNTLWVARPGRGITEETSDWEPVAHPVPDATLDGRFMEGTTYLEHSVLGVSLDSGPMEGMSSLEPLEQSVLNTLSAAQL